MTTKRKVVFGVSVILIVIVSSIIWFAATISKTLHDCYGQWVSAELVILYHQQYRQLPASWDVLAPVYGDGKGLHHGGLTFPQIKERMIIDFEHLNELESLADTTTNAAIFPKIVYTKSGVKTHWQGAEPNQMIYEYFKELKNRNPTNSLK